MDSATSTRRIAVSRLHLPDGTVLKNHVIEFVPGSSAQVARYFPLEEELPFTEWRGGDFHIHPEVSEKKQQKEECKSGFDG